MSVIVGIDPGVDGAVAIMRNGLVLDTHVMPTIQDGKKRTVDCCGLREIIASYPLGDIRLVVLEVVHSMPKQGVSSVFSFGRTYGRIEATVSLMGLPLETPTPQKWKKAVLEGTDKSKEATIAYVQRRFPGANLVPKGCRKPHDGIADAVAMCEFGRRLLVGKDTDA